MVFSALKYPLHTLNTSALVINLFTSGHHEEEFNKSINTLFVGESNWLGALLRQFNPEQQQKKGINECILSQSIGKGLYRCFFLEVTPIVKSTQCESLWRRTRSLDDAAEVANLGASPAALSMSWSELSVASSSPGTSDATWVEEQEVMGLE